MSKKNTKVVKSVQPSVHKVIQENLFKKEYLTKDLDNLPLDTIKSIQDLSIHLNIDILRAIKNIKVYESTIDAKRYFSGRVKDKQKLIDELAKKYKKAKALSLNIKKSEERSQSQQSSYQGFTAINSASASERHSGFRKLSSASCAMVLSGKEATPDTIPQYLLDFNRNFEIITRTLDFAQFQTIKSDYPSIYREYLKTPFLKQFLKSTREKDKCQEIAIDSNESVQSTLFSLIFILLTSNRDLLTILQRNLSSLCIVWGIISHGCASQRSKDRPKQMSCLQFETNHRVNKFNFAPPGYKNTYFVSKQESNNFLERAVRTAYFFNELEKVKMDPSQTINTSMPGIIDLMEREYGDLQACESNKSGIEERFKYSETSKREITREDCFNCSLINESINCVNRGYIPQDRYNSAAIVLKIYAQEMEKKDVEILSLYLKILPNGNVEIFDNKINFDKFYLSDLFIALQNTFLEIARQNHDYKKLIELPKISFVADATCGHKATCSNEFFIGVGKNKKQKTKNKKPKKQKTKKNNKTKKYNNV